MRKILLCLMVVLVLAVNHSIIAAESVLTLAENGAAHYRIVIPKEPTDVETTAAQELQSHLQMITGATFNIVPENELRTNDGHCIYIGHTDRADALYPDRDWSFDEINISVTDSDLILTGHERRGSLYAVYTFLEDVVGCRWWTENESFIPQEPTLTIPDNLGISYAPKMISREMYHRLAQPGIFSARLKGNGSITPEYGGRIDILSFVHSFYRYLPPEKYFKSHPEWYSELDGVRKVGLPDWHEPGEELKAFMNEIGEEHCSPSGSQLCLTNDEMRKELTRVVLEQLRAHPETRIVDISQNDCYNYCTCEKCRKIDEEEGSPSGTLLYFLNQVAEDIEKEFPDVLVETLAYQYTRKPPKNIRPRDNILIRLCSIECDFVRRLDTPENETFASDLTGWSSMSRQLFIWDYVTNYNDYVSPFPNYRVLAPNIRFFIQHKAIGLFEEGEGDDFPELRNWILSHLMWNPDLDETVLFNDFCNGYYGKEATPFLTTYFNLLSDAAEKSGKKFLCFSIPCAEWLDIVTLTEATKLMTAAQTAAVNTYGSESDQVRRLNKAKLILDQTWLSNNRYYRMAAAKAGIDYAGPVDPISAWQEFTRACQENGIIDLNIQTPYAKENVFEKRLNQMKSEVKAMENLPEFCNGIEENRLLVFDDAMFTNFQDAAVRVDDEAACDGKATQMSTAVDWNVNYSPHLTGRYHVWASLRCDADTSDVPAIGFGIYDPATEKGILSQDTQAGDLTGPEYKWIDYGTVDMTPDAYFYFAHRHNDHVPQVYVDRVIFIQERQHPH